MENKLRNYRIELTQNERAKYKIERNRRVQWKEIETES